MALYAFDGTGNEDQERDELDSNVVDFFNAYVDPKKNADPDEKEGSLYLKGIGTRARTIFGRNPAEAFGIGGHRRIRQAMERLENNLDAGDEIVDVIGFSRGAALSMSFANEIASKLPGVEIRFVGVFDVVAQFGLPGQHINAGHVVSLPANVKCCRHAMAMDESRALFPLTRLCGRGRRARRAPRGAVVPRCPFRHRRRQRQPRPELDRAELDVPERAARGAADSTGGDRPEPAGSRAAAADQPP